MGHGHHHPHGHTHHTHDTPADAGPLPPALDVSVPDSELSPGQLSRRSMVRRAGLLGAGLAGASVLGGAASAQTSGSGGAGGRGRGNGFLWLAGDHHIHTQYSSDGQYRVADQVRQGARHGRQPHRGGAERRQGRPGGSRGRCAGRRRPVEGPLALLQPHLGSSHLIVRAGNIHRWAAVGNSEGVDGTESPGPI